MSTLRYWPKAPSEFVADGAVSIWAQPVQIDANIGYVNPKRILGKVKELTKEQSASEALEEQLKVAWKDSVEEESKRWESPWQSTCFHGSLLKTSRMLAYILIWLPTLTLITEVGIGAAVVVALPASYLLLADKKLLIFVGISVAVFYCWCVFSGTMGKRKDVLGHAERIHDNNAVQVLMGMRVYRSNPYTKRITETEFLTVGSYKEYGFNTKLIWTLNLDEMDFDRPQTVDSNIKNFFSKLPSWKRINTITFTSSTLSR